MLFNLVQPKIVSVTMSAQGQPPMETTLPISVTPKSPLMQIHIDLDVPLIHPTRFFIRPDDCLDQIRVNGMPLTNPSFKFCDFTNGRTLSLSPYLRSGRNVIDLTVRDTGGSIGATFQASRIDPLVVGILSTIFVVALWCALFIIRRTGVKGTSYALALVMAFSLLLRLFYMLGTPFSARAYDPDGHVEYIRYIADHLALPDPHSGWEFYQPFLYYVFTGGWIKLGTMMGRGVQALLFDIQLFSVLATTLCIALTIFIGRKLFDARKEGTLLILFALAVSVFPGLVMMSSRITNDIPLTFLSFAAIATLISWSGRPSMRQWILLSIIVGVGLLSKSNMVLFLPIVLLSLAFQRHTSWKKKTGLAMLFLCIVTAVSGWFLIPRALQEEQAKTVLVGNSLALNGALTIPQTIGAYTTFNPAVVITMPFNNPWNDTARRQNFWEFFFRSAFFGEFQFTGISVLASFIITLAIIFIPVGLWGMYRELRTKAMFAAPLSISFIILLCGAVGFRVAYPFAPSQDFRFSVAILVPWMYFVLRGIQEAPSHVRRRLLDLFIVEIILCTLLMVLIPLVAST